MSTNINFQPSNGSFAILGELGYPPGIRLGYTRLLKAPDRTLIDDRREVSQGTTASTKLISQNNPLHNKYTTYTILDNRD
jgi:hypothetical protein